MKLKENIELSVLLNYGFEKIDKELEKEEDSDFEIYSSDYKFEVGHSRRGQFYYILVKERKLLIYATRPDGDGTYIGLPNVLIQMSIDGILE
jgi:hypothetical protein